MGIFTNVGALDEEVQFKIGLAVCSRGRLSSRIPSLAFPHAFD